MNNYRTVFFAIGVLLLILGAFMIQGINVGPLAFSQNPVPLYAIYGALILAKTTMGEFASRYVGSGVGVIRNGKLL